MIITSSTKVCSFGKQVVEKVEVRRVILVVKKQKQKNPPSMLTGALICLWLPTFCQNSRKTCHARSSARLKFSLIHSGCTSSRQEGINTQRSILAHMLLERNGSNRNRLLHEHLATSSQFFIVSKDSLVTTTLGITGISRGREVPPLVEMVSS